MLCRKRPSDCSNFSGDLPGIGFIVIAAVPIFVGALR
ncbi:hypothetical protein EP837_02969 [Sphingobium sp. EP60837]|nr:hypothetical protein EP837_02969 [Sphingobium sp. EP60837]